MSDFSSRENQIVLADKEKKDKRRKWASTEKAHVLYADGRFYFLNHLRDDNQPLHQDMKGQAELCNSEIDFENKHSRASTWARLLIFCTCKLCQPRFCVTWRDNCSYSDRCCFVMTFFQPKTLKNNHTFLERPVRDLVHRTHASTWSESEWFCKQSWLSCPVCPLQRA